MFGAGRLLHVDVVVDPGALVLGAELVLGLALPVLLLRGGERLTGYVALAVFGALAFLVIEPVTALLRTPGRHLLSSLGALAHRYGVGSTAAAAHKFGASVTGCAAGPVA